MTNKPSKTRPGPTAQSSALIVSGGSAIAGALSALGTIGKTLERIAEINFATEQLKLQAKKIKAQAKLMHRQIDASLTLALAQMAERRHGLQIIAGAIEKDFETGRVGLDAVVRAMDIYGEKIANAAPDDPQFSALLDAHKFFAGLVSGETAKCEQRLRDVVSSMQGRIAAIALPSLSRPLVGETGDDQ